VGLVQHQFLGDCKEYRIILHVHSWIRDCSWVKALKDLSWQQGH